MPRRLLFIVSALAILSPAVCAAAPRASASQLTYSLRATAGIGVGEPGFGYRLGVAGEYWLSSVIGVGAQGGLARQAAILGDESAYEIAELTVGLRSSPGPTPVIASFGAGYAHVVHTQDRLCLDLNGNGCPPGAVTRFGRVAISGMLAWLAHPGATGFSIGPSLRFDIVFDAAGHTDGLVTFNIELGFSQLSRAPRSSSEVMSP